MGYGLVLVIAVLYLGDALVLGVTAAVAPTMALLAYPNRPGLLLPAGAVAIASLYLMSIYGLPMVVIGLIWLWVHQKVVGSAPSGASRALVVGVVLWLAAPTVMNLHQDPVCEQTLRDGTVQEVDPATRGYSTGWVWDVDSSSFSGSGTAAGDIVSESCSSDSFVWWENAGLVAIAVASVYLSWRLTKPIDFTVQQKPAALV